MRDKRMNYIRIEIRDMSIEILYSLKSRSLLILEDVGLKSNISHLTS